MVFSGALERHPGLKLVLAESGVGWLPYFLTRMDMEWRALRDKLDYAPRIAPSELFRRQVMATFEEEQLAERYIPLLGADSCMWASDYPHTDSTFPESRARGRGGARLAARRGPPQDHGDELRRPLRLHDYRLRPEPDGGPRLTGARPDAGEIVIRGGTVFDGSGAPGRAADVAIAGRRDPRDRAEPARRARARRVGLRGRARLHRHPHPLRRAGVLGSGAPAVVVPRCHHRRRGQLRLHDRAHPPRAPRRDRAHARERRGHGPRDADRGHRVGVRDVPRVPGRGPPARDRRSTSRRTSVTPRCGST